MEDREPHALLFRSLSPMIIVDDERRLVDANQAACLLLRLPLAQIRSLSIDSLVPPPRRPALDALWSDLLQVNGTREHVPPVPFELKMPDGTSLAVELGGKPRVRPGRHLVVIVFPPARALKGRNAPTRGVLTKREREILTLVALGHTGQRIAEQLFLSPATVATHVTNALIKLGAKNRAHGIATALHAGELDLVDGAVVPRAAVDGARNGAG